MLTSRDFSYLVDKAYTYEQTGEFQLAINCYTQLITTHPNNATLYLRRASAYSELYDFESSVSDSRLATKLDPNNASPYFLLGGYLLSRELVNSKTIIASKDNPCFEEIICNYRLALEKDPSSQPSWINLIEVNLLMRYWDDAISYYGVSRPYITTPNYNLIRAFLGCLAITLAGDQIEPKDEEPLLDVSISITRSIYRFGEVTKFINHLDHFVSDSGIIARAKSTYEIFLSHFDDVPKTHYQHLHS